MSLTLQDLGIIATIAIAITAIYDFGKKLLEKLNKIDIYDFNNENSIIFSERSELYVTGKWHYLIKIGIQNLSSQPITIYEIVFNSPYEKGVQRINSNYNKTVVWDKITARKATKKSDKGTVEMIYELKKNAIILPLTIDSKKYSEGYIFFPFGKADENFENKSNIDGEIILRTTRGEIKHKLIFRHENKLWKEC